jgi:glutamate dehydrogenase
MLRPYFPAQLVATRDPLAHPLANAILATVLANESVNRCGPLMLRDLALEHRIDDTEVVKAWGQAWSALHLAPVFEALDADALKVPRDVSQAVDARTRVMLRTVIEGVLSLPAAQAGAGMDELSNLFAAAGAVRKQLMPSKSEADGHAGLSPSFVQAWKAVDTIESLAAFLFAAVSVQRPAGMSLAQFLQVGMACAAGRHRHAGARPEAAGHQQVAGTAAQLRDAGPAPHPAAPAAAGAGAQQGRRHAGSGAGADGAMGLTGYAQPTDLEQAMLDVWSLSEGSSPERLAA